MTRLTPAIPASAHAPKTKANRQDVALGDVCALMWDDLKRSGLTEANLDVEPSLTDLRGRASPGYKLYYPDPDTGKRNGFLRYRYLFPASGLDKLAGVDNKYDQPSAPPRAYFSRGIPWPALRTDAQTTLLITEGEKKAAAACKQGTPCIGLGGMWNWKTKDKEALIPDLAAFAWEDRRVVVVLDSDAATNAHVQKGADRLCAVLAEQGACPYQLLLPKLAPGEKTGLDDLLVAKGKPTFDGLVAEAKEWQATGNLLLQELNGVGNADRLLAWGKGRFRYVAAFKRWVVYDGVRWPVEDREQEAIRAEAHAMIRAFGKQAFKRSAENAAKFAAGCLNSPRITNLLREAQPNAVLRVDEMDRDPLLVNFRNGTFDARTGQLREHRREDFLTAVISHDYVARAQCPRWKKFVAETLDGDAQMIEFPQRALGYSLTGETSEKCILLAHGPKDTAKTTLLATVKTLLGDYAGRIKVESLMVERGRPIDANAQSDLADLRGKRFVMTSETGQGQRLREELVKLLSQGQGDYRAVRKYENPFGFRETWKIWMDCNHLPVVHGTDDAIWERLIVLPFRNRVPKSKQNPALGQELIAEEAAGILAWLADGLERWRTRRLELPAAMKQERACWRKESDSMGQWLEERCLIRRDAKTESTALYNSYCAWQRQNGLYIESTQLFARKMKEHGFEKKELGHAKVPTWLGVEVRS